MAEQVNKASDVFGISRDIPLNYTTRETVDSAFVDNLTRDQHIVVYGSSKQGKTCLRKYCLKPEDYITVHCSNRWGLRELHAAILKKAGFEVTETENRSVSGKAKVALRLRLGFGGIGGGGDGEAEVGAHHETVTRPLEIDTEDVNDVIASLESVGFSHYIVLEDFHYLPTDTQKDFAVALKAFHENSRYCFIVVGVWLEENRLTVYNGDLTGRVASVDADAWTEKELREVISTGETLLNIAIDATFVDALLGECQGSVYIVQEACHKACARAKVYRTQEQYTAVGQEIDVAGLVREIVNQQTGRYYSFLSQFADGFQDTQLHMHRWLLFPLLTATTEEIEEGLRLRQIRQCISTKHPQGDVNPGNVTQALKSAADLQVKKDIKPIIIDYDQTNLRLNVVDRGFLIWLAHQDKDDLLELVGLPV